MTRKIRVIIQNYLQKILNYYPNYPTHRLYFGEVETPYTLREKKLVYKSDMREGRVDVHMLTSSLFMFWSTKKMFKKNVLVYKKKWFGLKKLFCKSGMREGGVDAIVHIWAFASYPMSSIWKARQL